jgi:Sir2 family
LSSIGCFNHAEGFASAFLLRKEQGSWRRLSFFHRDGPLGICWNIAGQSDKRDLLICNYEGYGAGASYRLFVLTGAGVSAESGIPTFRGVNGLWRNYRIEEVASPDA